MMNKSLQDILYKTGLQKLVGDIDKDISFITMDSRQLRKGALFIAVNGSRVDGHNFIDQAVNSGAAAVICEHFPETLRNDVTYALVSDSSLALGHAASNFYGNPSSKINLVGITGTNGKTTTVSLLFRLFMAMGFKTGMLSTIETRINDLVLPSTHTTPDAISINKHLFEMLGAGCDYVFMEVSSHAIHQNRIAGLNFKVAIFSNITHDHLDYHNTFKDYLNAKKKFFDELNHDAFALVNIDDKNGKIMLQNTQARKQTYAMKSMADFKARVLENHFGGMLLEVNGIQFYSLLSGDFNAYNLLSVFATAVLLGFNPNEVLEKLSMLPGAEGRFEIIRSTEKQLSAIVDYAHTPDALLNVIKTINSLRTGNEKLITVVGAGGDRDKTKRPEMAQIASRLSDMVVLTSDNPRTEDPHSILSDMKAGVDPAKKSKTLIISDRYEAIKTALNLANRGDIILVAGKGHEKYQEINGVKHPFDDKKIIEELFESD
jgi:UDP-N-acetylmuramoyl-L-alanyl-D-glutamate--2,6-diaminopimelate ligase